MKTFGHGKGGKIGYGTWFVYIIYSSVIACFFRFF